MGSESTQPQYQLRISRLTVDKLGVKLYDKASAVVAELIANGYDADAENVTITLPLNTQLATVVNGVLTDQGYEIEVSDDGHGMTPEEAQAFYLRVGADRRSRSDQSGARSRHKSRPVMGRKGIGKLAPFGICRRIEVWSAGGEKTDKGYEVTHFYMDFDRIVSDEDESVALDVGAEDKTWADKSGTKIRLTNFLAKRVPDSETFRRQLASRFTFARPDFNIYIVDSKQNQAPIKITQLDIPVIDSTRLDVSTRPLSDGEINYPVTGWLAMAKDAYKHEEMMGVRIYARGKIIGVTRDFNQPAGFTGEFAMRSYLVGEINAEWLDLDDGEDLVRTDRQDILWDSDQGQLLRVWGATLIREIAKTSKEPRRARVRDEFLRKSDIVDKAKKRYGDKQVAKVAVELAKQFGGFAAEDELSDDDYVNDLSEIILSVAPHQALMEAFHEFSNKVTHGEATIIELVDVFDKAHIAELASYAQIASQRVKVISKLEEIIDLSSNEDEFQELLEKAPWLIEPSWTVISQNQGLKNFKQSFERYWKSVHKTEVVLAIDDSKKNKRPDFTLVSVDGFLHIVEIKKANHEFDDKDFERLHNYVDAFTKFFDQNSFAKEEFAKGWTIDIVADGEAIKDSIKKRAYDALKSDGAIRRVTWNDFLARAKKVHEQFLEVNDSTS